MALKYKPPGKPEYNADDVMVGICHACKGGVSCLRKDCKKTGGGFTVAGCPACGAAVSVMAKPKLVEKEFYSQ